MYEIKDTKDFLSFKKLLDVLLKIENISTPNFSTGIES